MKNLKPFQKCFISKAASVAVSMLLLLISIFCPVDPAVATQEMDFTELSIEELMNTSITSVAKKPQKLSDAAAAVFVISGNDIRRSGVTSIPEALRMVPGLQVARIDASKWAISSRGFNGRFANKLLVLIDGRSVYTPLFSGVFWDVQDTILEDVERIEVIRGPGAQLWGANAVNGVINIITKHARETQGGLVSAGIGTEDRVFGNFRYGAKFGNDNYYRAYVKYFDRDNGGDVDGAETDDGWDALRAGFRSDWTISDDNSFVLQGDIYKNDEGQTISTFSVTPPYRNYVSENIESSGGNVLMRWKRSFLTSDIEFQTYYDRTENKQTIGKISQETFDIDFQQRFIGSSRHEFTWGLGYRFIRDRINDTPYISFDTDKRNDNLFSAFLQDEIEIIKNLMYFTIGSKFEYNDYTGFEMQPGGRLLLTLNDRYSVWSSVTRAVSTPSRIDHDSSIPASSAIPPFTALNPSPFPVVWTVEGNPDYESEELIAYEFGIRGQLTDRLSMDIAAFYNKYDNLRTVEMAGMAGISMSDSADYLIVPLYIDNMMSGNTYGLEVLLNLKALEWWNIQVVYSLLETNLKVNKDSKDQWSEKYVDIAPQNQVSFRSSLNFGNTDIDLWLRYVDNILWGSFDYKAPDSYITLDLRVGWRPIKNLEFSIVGQNLIDSRHAEFRPELMDTVPTEVERSVYGKITWTF